MQGQILLAVLGTMVLLGAALFAALRADRRRESRHQRLKAIASAAPSAGGPNVSLRRPLRQRAVFGLSVLPAGLWTRLDAAFAATGNRIGVTSLAVTGLIAAAAAVVFAMRVMEFSPVLVIVLGGLPRWWRPPSCCASCRAASGTSFSMCSPTRSI